MANGDDSPLIFISYSSFDTETKEFVQRHFGVLQTLGDIEVWEDRQIDIGDDWFQEIKDKLETCAVAVLLISHDFLGSKFCMKKEVPVLLERRWREGMMIAPILLSPCAWMIVPWLRAIQMLPRKSKPLLALDYLEQAEKLTEVVVAIHEFLEEQKANAVEAEAIKPDAQPEIAVKTDTPYEKPLAVDLARLPTSGFDVVGRDDELRMLDKAFDGTQLNVVSLRAWGGVGKSTLVNKWCEYLAADNYRGARRVFAWSFYSQGTNQRVTSADAFIDEALRFFGDADPSAGSAWAKGERLAELVGREKALLILDGMEPLQDEHQGIKDPALARLVECLAVENAGLCVITTREPVKEFSDFPETTEEVDLEYLSKEAGRALLRIKGLRASDDLLEGVSEAFGNHALALHLLASFLGLARCPVEDALKIPDLPEVSFEDGKHPRRVMAAFAKQFGEGPALDLLHVMGLFDRPADGDCIAALREPAVPGLTDRLSALDQIGWRDLLDKLRDLGLLAPASHHDPDELDAHPLVREHCAAQLRDRNEEAWQAGHLRLYEHLKDLPKEHRPDSLAEMAPLFQAVHHGCQAGRRQEALVEVYHDRIVRQDEFYLVKKLGAFGADLGLVASFFDPPFDHPAADLTEPVRAWLLNTAAYNLRALGRLGEAVAPMRAGLEMAVEQEEWGEAARRASNLSELQLTLGEVAAAVASGEAAINHADRSGDDDWQNFIVSRTALADARHQAGEVAGAQALFEEAEGMQAESQPGYAYLYSLQGYRYCDLLLTLGQAEAVRERAAYALDLSTKFLGKGLGLHDIALDHLSLGRAALAQGDLDEARRQLDQAVGGLRGSEMFRVPGALLPRAALFREVGAFTESQKDLEEARRMAERGGMRLHQCDAHLGFARLALAESNPDAGRVHLEAAKVLVSACRYGRRKDEVEALEAKLGL